MSDSYERIYTVTLTEEEMHVLKSILRVTKLNAFRDKHGFMSVTMSLYERDIEQVKSIHEKLNYNNTCEQTAQPPIDMATVNAAFDRIREALADVDQVINPTKTICLLEEV